MNSTEMLKILHSINCVTKLLGFRTPSEELFLPKKFSLSLKYLNKIHLNIFEHSHLT